MPAGLQIINNSGTILLDENYNNLALAYKGSRTLTGTPLVTTFHTGTQVRNEITLGFTPTAKAVVAVRSSSRVWGGLQGNRVLLVGPPGAAITYYVFDIPPASTANYGLVVKALDGTVGFDATLQYARVSGVRSGSTVGSWDGAMTYPSGRTYAVAFLLPSLDYNTSCIQVGDPQRPETECYRAINYSGASISGATVTFGQTGIYHYIYRPGVQQNAASSTTSMVAAVIDVTAY